MDNNIVQLDSCFEQDATDMTITDMLGDMKRRVAAGEIRADAHCIVVTINGYPPEVYEKQGNDEPFDVCGYFYGVDKAKGLAIAECLKIQMLGRMNYL